MRVLFVCRSNAGRSPCAEAFFNGLAKKHKAYGAGLDVKETKTQGFPPGAMIIKAMRSYGLDISKMKRKQLTSGMAMKADRIVVILEKHEQKRFMPQYLSKLSSKTSFWSVKDPRNLRSGKSVLASIDAIRKRTERLVKELKS